MDDLTIARLRQAGLHTPAREEPVPGAFRVLQVYNAGAMPNAAPRVYACRPVELGAVEAEGNGFSSLASSAFIPVVFLGPALPALGERYIVSQIGGRWVATHTAVPGGGGPLTGNLLGCTCAHPPAVLTMTVATCTDGRFHNCTIEYQDVPAELGPLQLGAKAYLSNESFQDPQTGDWFRYFLSCFVSVVRISRVFATSVFGSPFLDSIIYYWSLGFPGNTCTPTFALTNGTVFAGGDPNCDVDITG